MKNTTIGRVLIFLVAAVFSGTISSVAQSSPDKTLSAEAGQPPGIPVVKPPVNFFRELLTLNASERDDLLKHRSPEAKAAILEKVREYEALGPDERELRLRATELRWYLMTLMPLAPTNRTAHLDSITEPMHKLVQDRLATWDKLSPDGKEAYLKADETALQRAIQILTRKLTLPSANSVKPTPEQARKIDADVARIRALPRDQQKIIAESFQQFYELNPEEKAKVLRVVSDSERKEIERTLRKFSKLPRKQQQQCINAFTQLASMPPEECRQFLENAERWQSMSPAQRRAWRDLVRQLPSRSEALPPPPPPGTPPVVSTNQRGGNQL